ncbi:sensor histidine kinase [Sphaerisporangium corydalis]|uniref:Sensor histidine kinase n=1 Tax=Sphaerisporangium corydalis TaxID=1441875 RepID=A0ABV9EPY9_9ACTN|nr:histidine kinase [Sphaerisporangium corydalis]
MTPSKTPPETAPPETPPKIAPQPSAKDRAATPSVIGSTAPSIMPAWVLRHPHWPLVALHVPLTVQAPVYSIIGMEGRPSASLVMIPVAAALGALQLRHSLAAARGERPAGWRWSYAALLLLVYVPVIWIGTNWEAMGIMALASTMMLLRPRTALPLCAAEMLVPVTLELKSVIGGPLLQIVIMLLYAVVVPPLFTAALVGGARLVRLVNELYATRTELAAAAVGEERVRVSRDLHDLLGQSLSAISLKGDLALRLLAKDVTAARGEVESLTGVAREALRGVRAIARDEHAVSLRTEIEGAAALLGAAGVDTEFDVAELPPLRGPAQDALAWAIREGTTNLLRHSEAQSCSITLSRHHGTVRLEIVNDGVRGVAASGSGLAGVGERARAVSGTSAAVVRNGRFILSVDVPEEAL